MDSTVYPATNSVPCLETVPVVRSEEVARNVRVISFRSERIAGALLPGQFVNVKPDSSYDPLLRRAYSVHRALGDELELIYNVHGKGSAIFATKRPGDPLDVMGPLGRPFNLDGGRDGEFREAILVSGGLGIAPMPILGDALHARGIRVVNIHGARTGSMIVQDDRLRNPRYTTDDGSLGLHGNVVQGVARYLDTEASEGSVRLFACGPNRMLEGLAAFADARGLPLEVSLECQMACGIGICQGCPVEMKRGERRYTLVCTHGPNYDVSDILLESLPGVHG